MVDLGDEYCIEIGTARGRQLVGEFRGMFVASDSDFERRNDVLCHKWANFPYRLDCDVTDLPDVQRTLAAKTCCGTSGNPIYLPIPARIVKVETITAWEKLYTLALPNDLRLAHEPGQFVQLTVFGIGEAPISINVRARRAVYGDEAHRFDTCPVRPIGAVINVDFAIPGCPINPDEFLVGSTSSKPQGFSKRC